MPMKRVTLSPLAGSIIPFLSLSTTHPEGAPSVPMKWGGGGAVGNGDRTAVHRIREFPAVVRGRAIAVVVLHVLAAHPIYDRGAFGGRAGAQHGLGDDRVGIGHP